MNPQVPYGATQAVIGAGTIISRSLLGPGISLAITNGGAGYLSTPTVTIGAPPSGGTQATAVAIMTGGVVTGFSITNAGNGYVSAPTVTIAAPPSGGTQATATATVNATNWIPFLEVFKTPMPDEKLGKVKATHYLSPNGIHEYIAGWGDPKAIVVEANYLRSERINIRAQKGIRQYFQIQYPDGSTATSGSTDVFPGYIDEIDGEVPNEDKITSKFTIQATGKTVFTAGS